MTDKENDDKDDESPLKIIYQTNKFLLVVGKEILVFNITKNLTKLTRNYYIIMRISIE